MKAGKDFIIAIIEVLVPFCTTILFWNLNIKVYNLSPEGGAIDVELAGRSAPVPIVPPEYVEDALFFTFLASCG